MNTFGTVIRINKAHTHSVSLGLSGWRLRATGIATLPMRTFRGRGCGTDGRHVRTYGYMSRDTLLT